MCRDQSRDIDGFNFMPVMQFKQIFPSAVFRDLLFADGKSLKSMAFGKLIAQRGPTMSSFYQCLVRRGHKANSRFADTHILLFFRNPNIREYLLQCGAVKPDQ